MNKIIGILILAIIPKITVAQTSLEFDGTDDFVDTNYDGILGNNTRTVEFWFKITGTGQRGFVEWGNGGTGERFTILANGSKLRAEVAGNGINGPTDINDGIWHHAAIVYNDALATNKMTMYLDGVFEVGHNFTVTVNTSTVQNVKIGKGIFPSLRALNGEMDDVRFWNNARTQAEIQDGMFHELVGTETNLEAYYSMESATIAAGGVVDLAGANNGTMTNMDAADIVTSYAALRTTDTQNEIRGIWEATGTANSFESDGFWMSVNSDLSQTNYATFGHNNQGSDVVSSDLPGGLAERYAQIWNVIEVGSVVSNITFDLSTIHGVSLTAGAVAGYKLLYRSGESGVFTDLGSATSIANVDQVTFTGIALTDGYYTIGTINSTSSTLPVELVSFKTTPVDQDIVKLDWQTASEINNDYFTVERSEDGRNWQELVRVDGTGNSSSLLSYSTVDSNPLIGLSYYRLKQTDFDGQFEYSKINSVNIRKLGFSQLEVYPNPIIDRITILGNSSELAEVFIYNSLGQDITSLTQPIENTETKVVIDFSKLTPSHYYIKTKTTTNIVVKQ